MRELDPDDPRPPYRQVANSLRAAILTRRFQPRDKLPSGPELSRHYGVARMTVQQAIRLLRDEGLVVSRQGSGVYVRQRTERPVGLRPHLARAFHSGQVSIDFAGVSGQPLHDAVVEPLGNVRAGRLRPDSIRVRIMVPDPAAPWTLPARVHRPPVHESARQITRHGTRATVDAVNELGELGLVDDVHAEIRVAPSIPLITVYLINDADAFFGFCPVQEHMVQLDGEPTPMWDPAGNDAMLFHHAADNDPDSMASQYVSQCRMWFDTVWTTVAREPTP